MTLAKRTAAELVGTFWLVFGGCGSAIFAAKVGETGGIGWLGVSLAFGLTVLTMAYALGPVSGAHLNPAVTVAMCVARRFAWRDALPYIIVQVVGAVAAAGALYAIARGRPGFDLESGFAANGYGVHSPAGYSMMSGALAEIVLTLFFVLVILATTHERAPVGFAPIAIGLALTLIHLIGIPITNTSVNPARSTGPALFVGGWAVTQLWMFWLAPIGGGVLGALLYRALGAPARSRADEAPMVAGEIAPPRAWRPPAATRPSHA